MGNFKHNANVINDGIGEIIVVRRQAKQQL